MPKLLPLVALLSVYARLDEESVPVRDMRAIASAVVANAARSFDEAELTEIIWSAIGGAILHSLAALREPAGAIALDPALEALLSNAVRASGGRAQPFDPELGARVGEAVSAAAAPLTAAPLTAEGRHFVIVTIPVMRRPLWVLLRVRPPQPVMLAFSETPDDRNTDVVVVVGGPVIAPVVVPLA